MCHWLQYCLQICNPVTAHQTCDALQPDHVVDPAGTRCANLHHEGIDEHSDDADDGFLIFNHRTNDPYMMNIHCNKPDSANHSSDVEVDADHSEMYSSEGHILPKSELCDSGGCAKPTWNGPVEEVWKSRRLPQSLSLVTNPPIQLRRRRTTCSE